MKINQHNFNLRISEASKSKRWLEIEYEILKRMYSLLAEKPPKGLEFQLGRRIVEGDLKAVEFLLQTGMDVNTGNEQFKCPPLAVAVQTDNLAAAELLLKSKANVDLNWHHELVDCRTLKRNPDFTVQIAPKTQKISEMKMSEKMKRILVK